MTNEYFQDGSFHTQLLAEGRKNHSKMLLGVYYGGGP